MSRSGATITAGLFLGLDRSSAARFSFLLSVPAVVLSGLLELGSILSGEEGQTRGDRQPDRGDGVRVRPGYAAIALLLRYLSNHTTVDLRRLPGGARNARLVLVSSGAIK